MSARGVSVDEQVRLLMRGVEYGDAKLQRAMESELRERLEEGRPLRVYCGYDPTATELTLGNAVSMRKLRQFQDLGHDVTFLIGNFTGLVGDPSDKDAARPMLTAEQLEENSRTWLRQAFRVLDESKTRVRYNAEWLAKLTFADVIRLSSYFTVAQFLERDIFVERRARNEPIHLHEFLYALLQAYDAVAMETDVQVGGSDQLFNIMAGRTLQRALGQKPQIAVTMPILLGTDGKLKMSKSAGNHISLDATAEDMYGKVMSIPDTLIVDYFTLVTGAPAEEVAAVEKQLSKRSLNPMELKKRLARRIVTEYHSEPDAGRAEEQFERVFQRGEAPEDSATDLPWHTLPFVTMLDLAGKPLPPPTSSAALPVPVDMASLLAKSLQISMNEAGRLITQGAVSVDGRQVTARTCEWIEVGSNIRVGKHRFLRIVDAHKTS